jgi:hypothetical protein
LGPPRNAVRHCDPYIFCATSFLGTTGNGPRWKSFKLFRYPRTTRGPHVSSRQKAHVHGPCR